MNKDKDNILARRSLGEMVKMLNPPSERKIPFVLVKGFWHETQIVFARTIFQAKNIGETVFNWEHCYVFPFEDIEAYKDLKDIFLNGNKQLGNEDK